MARINEAFEILIDEARREEYDAMLAGAVRETVQEHSPKNPVKIKLLRRLQGHKTPVYAVSFAPDSGKLISVGFDNEVIWWGELGEKSRQTKLEAGNVSVLKAMSEDRVVAAGSNDSQVSVWCLDQNKISSWKNLHEEWVSCLAISADGHSVASGSIHHHLRVCDSATGSARFSLRTENASVTAVAFSPDGQYLASGTAEAKVSIREAKSGRWLKTIERVRSVVTALAFSSDNRYIAVAGVDLSIRVFDVDSGRLVKMLYGHGRPIEAIAFHPNGWLFASASRDGTVGLWNAAKGIGNVRLEVSSRPVSCVAFSADGNYLAVSGQDKLVRLFEVSAKLH